MCNPHGYEQPARPERAQPKRGQTPKRWPLLCPTHTAGARRRSWFSGTGDQSCTSQSRRCLVMHVPPSDMQHWAGCSLALPSTSSMGTNRPPRTRGIPLLFMWRKPVSKVSPAGGFTTLFVVFLNLVLC